MPNLLSTKANTPKQTKVTTTLAPIVSQKPSRGRRFRSCGVYYAR
jgi:hypothetical protein